jgi:hypothetical protein
MAYIKAPATLQDCDAFSSISSKKLARKSKIQQRIIWPPSASLVRHYRHQQHIVKWEYLVVRSATQDLRNAGMGASPCMTSLNRPSAKRVRIWLRRDGRRDQPDLVQHLPPRCDTSDRELVEHD